MDVSPPVWVIDAIPPVLSAQLFGHAVRYTSLNTVSDQFYRGLERRSRKADGLDATMDEIARLNRSQVGAEYRLLGPEDKGIVDFVAAAFRVFGRHTRAITWLYLIVILASGLALLVASRGSLAIVAWLVFFLLSHALLTPMVTLNPQLGSYLALRAIPAISMVACFHLLFFALRPTARPLYLTLVILQALLVVFAIHLRTTAQWQVVAVALVACSLVVARAWRDRRPSLFGSVRRHAVAGVPVAALALGLVGLQIYRSVAYPVEYQRGDQILTRGVWHNVISGFAFHPAFAEREQLRIDDVSIMRAVGRYLMANGRADEWAAMGGETRNLAGLRWASYEPAAREFLLHICRTEPDVCLSTALYYKPRSLVGLLAWAGGMQESPPNLDVFVSRDWGDDVKVQMLELNDRLHRARAFAEPWKPEALLFFGLMVLALAISEPHAAHLSWAASLALFGGSVLTTIVGYPAAWTIVDPSLAAEATLYLGLGLGIAWLTRRLARTVSTTMYAQPGRV
jgi:hypothetical protein